ncbi:MAG: ABC transporter ATP-binding protein [Clostridia bacterium]|nr:ABC transporter ATP-binding protein [Clostridia bacterium]
MKLKTENISVSYDGEEVLKNLSLEVDDGEFVSLLGPSGCGKSTLIKAVAGIVPLKGGRVMLGERDITNLPVHKRETAVLFQDMRLFPHMNILDNTAFPLKMQGVPKTERYARARELLKLVQMYSFEGRLPNELSGGQQQRAALARALAAKPKLLLLDEPFSALDENLREDMRELVLELHRQFSMTTILVTHDREEALGLSDRVAVMSEGGILQIDTPQKLYSRPNSPKVADYFGNCTYVEGAVRGSVFTGGTISIDAEVLDGRYRLLLRSENFLPKEEGSLEVTVESIRFRGSDTLVTFRGADGLAFCKAYASAPDWKAGDKLSCGLNIESPVLFGMD